MFIWKWYNIEELKYETYCTNTLENGNLWQEKKKY